MPKELERKIIPAISVNNADKYVAFLSEAFGAEQASPIMKDPNGKARMRAREQLSAIDVWPVERSRLSAASNAHIAT